MTTSQIQIGKTYYTTHGIVRSDALARRGGWDTTNVADGAKRRVTAGQIRYQAIFVDVVMAQMAA